MNILEYCTQEDKKVIGCIVDGYLLDYDNIKINDFSYCDSPGLFFFSIFHEYNPTDIDCHINLSNNNGILTAEFFVDNDSDSNSQSRIISLKKAGLMSRICFIENLFKNNLIFFESDNNDSLPLYNEPNKKSLGEFSEENIKVHAEPIYSQTFFDLINKFYWSRVIPSSILIEYRRNNYLTTEQLRHNKQIRHTWYGIIVAILIGIVSPLLTSIFSKVTIEDTQFNQIIKSHSNDSEIPYDISSYQVKSDSTNISITKPIPY